MHTHLGQRLHGGCGRQVVGACACSQEHGGGAAIQGGEEGGVGDVGEKGGEEGGAGTVPVCVCMC